MSSYDMHLEIHFEVLQGSLIYRALLYAAAQTLDEHKSDE